MVVHEVSYAMSRERWVILQELLLCLLFFAEESWLVWSVPEIAVGEMICWGGSSQRLCPLNLPQFATSWCFLAMKWGTDMLVCERKTGSNKPLEIVQLLLVELVTLRVSLVWRWFLLDQGMIHWSFVSCKWLVAAGGHWIIDSNFAVVTAGRWTFWVIVAFPCFIGRTIR